MKLQKQLSRKTKTKEYAKWVLVIPPDIVQDVGFKEGQELKATSTKKRLVIESKD